MSKTILLIAVVILVTLSIWYLESRKRMNIVSLIQSGSVRTKSDAERIAEKEKKFSRAREIALPSGFINTDPFSLQEFAGKKAVMVDFWTYSCINCQRTIPFLAAWHEKYKDQGLVVIGIHTPEFAFEKDVENVRQAVGQLGIRYPVVLDNDYATWNAYQNRYWPRKYLIDIDGFIVYDHIGEGGYEETEKKIQEVLRERTEVLGGEGAVAEGAVAPNVRPPDFSKIKSPETYFGSARNRNFPSGKSGYEGTFSFPAPRVAEKNTLYLSGEWGITPEFAENKKGGSKILFRYDARDVFLVADAEGEVKIRVLRDGTPVQTLSVGEERLYHIIAGDEYGEHVLEIIVEGPGLRAFAFTFG